LRWRDQVLAEAIFKQITGGDKITTRFLYKEFFEYAPEYKPFIAANHFPQTSGDDDAVWRRILVIPFDVSIPAERRDRNLTRKLRDELPGIRAWAVKGCLMWQREAYIRRTSNSARKWASFVSLRDGLVRRCVNGDFRAHDTERAGGMLGLESV
jgi:P4 family phage/plasmid primase-like protien